MTKTAQVELRSGRVEDPAVITPFRSYSGASLDGFSTVPGVAVGYPHCVCTSAAASAALAVAAAAVAAAAAHWRIGPVGAHGLVTLISRSAVVVNPVHSVRSFAEGLADIARHGIVCH